MERREFNRFFGGFLRDFQAVAHLLRNPCSLGFVSVKVAVFNLAIGLAYIVQKRGKADTFIRVHNRAEGMLQNVVTVNITPLRHTVAKRKLG